MQMTAAIRHRQRYQLLLVELTPEQIVLAKRANGARKQITHAVLEILSGLEGNLPDNLPFSKEKEQP